jgi:hypothetical protein
VELTLSTTTGEKNKHEQGFASKYHPLAAVA